MRVVVLHGAVAADARRDEADVLVERDTVCAALGRLGHEALALGVGLDLDDARRRLHELRPALVFNLVESIDGHGRLIHLAPALLDVLGLPYTGARAEAQFCTSNKLIAKQLLAAAAVPTPAWTSLGAEGSGTLAPGQTVIVKSVWEHASVGLDEESVFAIDDHRTLERELERRRAADGGDWFAEAFVEGRELNVALLGSAAGVEVLPMAEIRFEGYAPDKRQVVGYRAKWDESSFEYQHTRRSFDVELAVALRERLGAIARRCWTLFALHGHARVDLRLDGEGEPWVLEVNTNPCISPDAGFMAAATRGGLDIDAVVARIIADVPAHRSRPA